jgi:gliding motility-associated transport system permease protein/gliding motility-associatede transport system auxiliary component
VTFRTTRALATRDLRRYFANPIGYVFITLFIFLSGVAAFWRPRFFLNNLANLDQLNEVFPLLLLFFVAALTMGVWAEERKAGSDELLLTLPATDLEVVLGKYLAVVGVYTIALLFAVSHAIVLAWLGSPDPGLLVANYIGYWLAGAALIAGGMFASLLTANTAIAFVLAVLVCAVPVAASSAAAVFSAHLARIVEPFTVPFAFEPFARGILDFDAKIYFVLLTAFFLYLNLVLLSRRHWRAAEPGLTLGGHYLLRVVLLVVCVVAVQTIVRRAAISVDVTAERIHTLSDETRRLIAEMPGDRQVSIQAFVSPDVPQDYVQQRESVLSVLHDVAAIAPDRIQLTIDDTQPYSASARTARERYGIVPRLVTDEPGLKSGSTSAGGSATAVFLGVAVTSGADEQVIPFFDRGLAAEYEITRALRVAARTGRKRIGVVDGDAGILGGADYETGRTRLPWAIVSELKRQYDVVKVTPWDPIGEGFDALLVAQPSTLLQQELQHAMDAVKRGVPTLMLLDPMPTMDMRLAPAASMAARANPYAAENQAIVRKNTGDIVAAVTSIGVAWNPARIVWDSYRAHPDLDLPQEVVFVGPGSGNMNAFNPSRVETAGLQDLPLMFPGSLARAEDADVEFEPLLQTGTLSGTASYFQLVQPTEAGPMLNAGIPHQPENQVLTLAARVHRIGTGSPLNAIVVADLDFIADQVFVMREEARTEFDNVTFFLNCIDVLAGDSSFVELRKRRPKYRTLTRVEEETRAFARRMSEEERNARADSDNAIAAAREAVDRARREVEKRPDLDPQSRQVMVRNVLAAENRKLRALQANVEQARDARIEASREAMEAGVRQLQGFIRTIAVVLPPIPVLIVGALVFLRRRSDERRSAVAAGRAGSTA